MAFTATPTATSVTPGTGWRANVSAMPAIISPTISISLCTPPIRWMITSGLSTQIHSATAPLAPMWRAIRGAAQISIASPGSMHSRSTMVPAMTLSPTSMVTNLATMMNAGPYGAVVVVQIGLTLSSRMFGFSIGPTAYGSKPSRNSAPCARYEYVSRLNTGTDSSSGASQKPVVATIVYSLALRSATRRPSHSHANSMTATPHPQQHRRQHQAVAEAQPGQVQRLQQRVVQPGAAGAQPARGDEHRAQAAQQCRAGLRRRR